jgi:hypothetical protein
MEPQSIPFKDIHLPTAISWWPPAPGWWLLAALLITAVLIVRFRKLLYQWIFIPGKRKTALRQLDAIVSSKQFDTGDKVQKISSLLRQFSLSFHEREQVAGLTGEAWLSFLDDNDAKQPFSSGIGRQLIEAPYRPDADVDIKALAKLCRRWLKKHRKPSRTKQSRASTNA